VAYAWGRANIRAGDEIVLTEMEHHSNIVPWQILAQEKSAELTYLQIDGQGHLVLDDLDLKITPRTKLVAVTLMSNVLGTINPVRQIADAAHAAGALVLVDGAQGVPHMPVDAADCPISRFWAKMLGPTASADPGRGSNFHDMPPFHGGGEMILRVGMITQPGSAPQVRGRHP
jgi:cysteine desulfurase/selenocysteine lyase